MSAGMSLIYNIYWSPDSKALALAALRKDGKIGMFHFPLSRQQNRPIILGEGFTTCPKRFTPDGKEFVICKIPHKEGDKQEHVAVDVETGKERKVRLPESVIAWHYDVSPDQTQIVYAEKEANGPEQNIVIVDRDLKDKRVIGRSKQFIRPCWSPDGTKIAYGCNFQTGGFVEVRIVAANGRWQTKVNVGSYKIQGTRPDWSPDSRKLALTLTEERCGEIGLLENFLPKEKLAAK